MFGKGDYFADVSSYVLQPMLTYSEDTFPQMMSKVCKFPLCCLGSHECFPLAFLSLLAIAMPSEWSRKLTHIFNSRTWMQFEQWHCLAPLVRGRCKAVMRTPTAKPT